MDDLDRIQAAEEATMQRLDLGSAVPRDGTDETPNLEDYICRIGVINTENGWYGLGYNEHTKALQLMEKVV